MSSGFQTPDVRELRGEEFPKTKFPATGHEEFRIHFDEKVHEQIAKHAAEDTSVEVGGVLVGAMGTRRRWSIPGSLRVY